LAGKKGIRSGITLAGLFFRQQQALALHKNLRRRLANCPCIKLRRNKINQNVQQHNPGQSK